MHWHSISWYNRCMHVCMQMNATYILLACQLAAVVAPMQLSGHKKYSAQKNYMTKTSLAVQLVPNQSFAQTSTTSLRTRCQDWCFPNKVFWHSTLEAILRNLKTSLAAAMNISRCVTVARKLLFEWKKLLYKYLRAWAIISSIHRAELFHSLHVLACKFFLDRSVTNVDWSHSLF